MFIYYRQILVDIYYYPTQPEQKGEHTQPLHNKTVQYCVLQIHSV